MAVQIFMNEELSDTLFQVDSLEEWKQLASEMGLEEQVEMVKGKNSPNPYPYMSRGIQTVMETLCPEKVRVEKYNKTPIPLEVMRQLSFSIKENHFQHIEIWYDDKTPDPLAVGYNYDWYASDKSYNKLRDENKKDVLFKTEQEAKDYCEVVGFAWHYIHKTNENKYLIARWGDELKPFNELKSVAKERILEKYGAELKNEIEEKQQAIKKLENNAILFLNGEITSSQLKGSRW